MHTKLTVHKRPRRAVFTFLFSCLALSILIGVHTAGAVDGHDNSTESPYNVGQTNHSGSGSGHGEGQHEKAGGHGNCSEEGHGDGHSEEHDEHGAGPLEVATLNYMQIRDPLIFTIVVILAGISKIGMEIFLLYFISFSCSEKVFRCNFSEI